jgi:hypothetical protein
MELKMFENLKNLTSAALIGGGILATSSGCAPKLDGYGCCVDGPSELSTGCRAEVLAERLANSETKDSPEVAKLKSEVIGTFAFYVSREIEFYQRGNKHGNEFSHLVQNYLARCETSGISAEFPPSLLKNLELLKSYREHFQTHMGNAAVDRSRNP